MYEKDSKKFTRDRCLFSLAKEEFDIAIIGGGITGAGIARDAAMRGLSVALIEAKDFASGTSSRSSKLLHGGIRYLENFHFRLVMEASRERRLHSDFLAPHLAIPVPFTIPVYSWSTHSLATISAGVFLYNALALFRNHGTKYLNKETLITSEPNLDAQQLKGGVTYYDVVMDDARLVLENIRSSVDFGAVAVNYTVARGFEKDSNGKIIGIWVKDVSPLAQKLTEDNLGNGSDLLLRAKVIINASGPWTDYIRKLDQPERNPILRPTKGIHLVLPNNRFSNSNAFVLSAKKDSRVFFSIPWYSRTLVGTTDTDYDPRVDGDLNNLLVTQNEVDYLLESVKRTFPHSGVNEQEVQSAFAGVRPLIIDQSAGKASSVSREHKIFQDESGLFTIAGGKYTTYRTMAKELVDEVITYLTKHYSEFGNRKYHNCMTALFPIVTSETMESSGSHLMGIIEEYGSILGESTLVHLQARYGIRWREVAKIAIANKELAERIIPCEPDIMAEAIFSRKEEMAMSLEDFFRRRTMLALKAPLVNHLDRIQLVAKILFGNDIDWNPTTEEIIRWQGLQFKSN